MFTITPGRKVNNDAMVTENNVLVSFLSLRPAADDVDDYNEL